MRRLLVSGGMLLRRRSCTGSGSGPLLLLLGVALCLFYQTLTVARNRLRVGPQQPGPGPCSRRPGEEEEEEETRRLISALEAARAHSQAWSELPLRRPRAVVLTGQHLVSDTEVQLYQLVLQQMDYEVQLSRYTETSSVLRSHHGVSGWSLLLSLSSSERSCLRLVSFSHLQRHQMVNLMPGLMGAFSDAGGGLCRLFTRSHLTGESNRKPFTCPGSGLLMRPYSCGSTNQKQQVKAHSHSPVGAPLPALVTTVNVYILVTSLKPLTSFLHEISVVMTNYEQRGQAIKLINFLLQQFGAAASQQALWQVRKVIGDVLEAAILSNAKQQSFSRCVWCYQLLTFTLLYNDSITPVIIQVDTDVTLSSLSDDTFERQITRDLILEDTLRLLLPTHTHLSLRTHLSSDTGQQGDCRRTHGVCLSEDDFLRLLQFQQQMKTPSSFQLLYPSVSPSSSCGPLGVSDLQVRISRYYQLQKNDSMRTDETKVGTNREPSLLSSQDGAKGPCVQPRLRQIYTDPPLILTPPFSPWVKEYHAEVTFDTVMVRIRPVPVSLTCGVHLDEHQGPRMANYPVGLGYSRIIILVTDNAMPQPVVMSIYTIHMYRESRPSLPMFGDHVTCSFLQDCGLLVQPGQPCGLQPFIKSQNSHQTCSSGHIPGQWVVPCLSCSDNRTCDWREVAWQPDGCYHPLVDRRLLQDCMAGRKVLFIGDSTNRGMMYFLMERVNSSLEVWGKAHDTLVYKDLNRGQTLVSYSYYPQFWVEKNLRPTFRQALLQLISRSQPLVNSPLTVLVVGGVQWLSTDHLRTIREVLSGESLSEILVVVKSLGMGFHLPVDGIRSLSLREIQELYRENRNIITTAKHHGYEVIDTFSITMGRYKEFLQGRCACHFHEVKFRSSSKSHNTTTRSAGAGPGVNNQSSESDRDQEVWLKAFSYHVRGSVNQVYSEILLSRLCPKT